MSEFAGGGAGDNPRGRQRACARALESHEAGADGCDQEVATIFVEALAFCAGRIGDRCRHSDSLCSTMQASTRLIQTEPANKREREFKPKLSKTVTAQSTESKGRTLSLAEGSEI